MIILMVNIHKSGDPEQDFEQSFHGCSGFVLFSNEVKKKAVLTAKTPIKIILT